ncbi:hypothetical protein [Cryptosporangium sp. NPDC048952]|uniref:hypothetical protein n=1 Tax=Cryptosporangium sp. NPDC048952 TaxID=3363961 RepID=UPI003718342E
MVEAALAEGLVDIPEDGLRQAEESSRARAEHGEPIHDIMPAFRFAMGSVRDGRRRPWRT